MARFKPLLITLIGPLVLWLAWPPVGFATFAMFFAFIFLLHAESTVANTKKFFAITYLHMFLWNILVTWWVWNASLPGALGAFFANSLIMCLPWLLFRFTKRKLGSWIGYGSLIIYWISFEYIHHNWELSWPWLTLGNSLSMHPEWIQWYEYTGTTGGTLWILLLNILIFNLLVEFRGHRRSRLYHSLLASVVVLLLVPIVASRLIGNRERDIARQELTTARRNVVIAQPNIDPYEEKFSADVNDQIKKLIVLSEMKIDKDTRLVIWPETAIPVSVNETEIKTSPVYTPIWSFLNRHPFINLISGINSYRVYGTNKKDASSTARLDKQSGIYYDEYNTAASFDADTTVQLYHKAKLVPGVETLPSFLNFMSSWFEDFGGISGTLGRDSERKVFIPWDNHFKAAPVICYESIYGDYMTEYVRKGANILTIITNDGWWDDTPGYKQHMNYARLRAIETRKWVARSANTGISCFIDPLGNSVMQEPWDTEASIKMTIPIDNRMTFYVRHGDLLSRATLYIAALLIVISMVFALKQRSRNSSRPGKRL